LAIRFDDFYKTIIQDRVSFVEAQEPVLKHLFFLLEPFLEGLKAIPPLFRRFASPSADPAGSKEDLESREFPG
jgi:hypothetical protein